MPAAWPVFQSSLTAYLTAKKAKKEKDTAKKIAQLYHAAVKTAMPILVPGSTLTVSAAAPIESGFVASFKMGKALGGAPNNPGIWMPAAMGVVTYWTGKLFNPAVPPPTWLPGGVNNVLVPGVPPAPQIYAAMSAQTAAGVSAGLVAAFSTHLLSVSGMFTGPNAASFGAPVPFPWVGVA
jgi:hypothetical protein